MTDKPDIISADPLVEPEAEVRTHPGGISHDVD